MAIWILLVAVIYVVSWAWLFKACRQTYGDRTAAKADRVRRCDVEILYRERSDY